MYSCTQYNIIYYRTAAKFPSERSPQCGRARAARRPRDIGAAVGKTAASAAPVSDLLGKLGKATFSISYLFGKARKGNVTSIIFKKSARKGNFCVKYLLGTARERQRTQYQICSEKLGKARIYIKKVRMSKNEEK